MAEKWETNEEKLLIVPAHCLGRVSSLRCRKRNQAEVSELWVKGEAAEHPRWLEFIGKTALPRETTPDIG